MLIRTMTELESKGRIIPISHGKSSAVRLLTKSNGVDLTASASASPRRERARARARTSGTRTTGRRTSFVPATAFSRTAAPGSSGHLRPASCTASAPPTGTGSRGTPARGCASSATLTRRSSARRPTTRTAPIRRRGRFHRVRSGRRTRRSDWRQRLPHRAVTPLAEHAHTWWLRRLQRVRSRANGGFHHAQQLSEWFSRPGTRKPGEFSPSGKGDISA